MNRDEMMKMQQKMLVRARAYIETRSIGYICDALYFALKDMSPENNIDNDLKTYVKSPLCLWVEEMLNFKNTGGYCPNLGVWLRSRGFDLNSDDRAELRLRWIDWMLKQLESNTAQELIQEIGDSK